MTLALFNNSFCLPAEKLGMAASGTPYMNIDDVYVTGDTLKSEVLFVVDLPLVPLACVCRLGRTFQNNFLG